MFDWKQDTFVAKQPFVANLTDWFFFDNEFSLLVQRKSMLDGDFRGLTRMVIRAFH